MSGRYKNSICDSALLYLQYAGVGYRYMYVLENNSIGVCRLEISCSLTREVVTPSHLTHSANQEYLVREKVL